MPCTRLRADDYLPASDVEVGWLLRRAADLIALSPEGRGPDVGFIWRPRRRSTESTGRYFVKEKPAAARRSRTTRDAARRLWQVSEELTGLPRA